jgi:hypothetical protein
MGTERLCHLHKAQTANQYNCRENLLKFTILICAAFVLTFGFTKAKIAAESQVVTKDFVDLAPHHYLAKL